MKKIVLAVSLGFAAVALVLAAAGDPSKASAPAWSFNATIIEACSCPLFCQCYFNSKPAAQAGHEGHAMAEHYCRFNNAFRVNKGKYGDVALDGTKFWVAGDLGDDFSKGQMQWAVVTFEPSTTKAQRDAIAAIMGKVYPVKWNSFAVGTDAAMTWTATKEHAEAKLDGGKTAEVVLDKFAGMTGDPVVIKNLKYWGVPRNEGFVLMPNEVEAYRTGNKTFEFKGTNGFMITIDIASSDVS
jgi:hypothetical protein